MLNIAATFTRPGAIKDATSWRSSRTDGSAIHYRHKPGPAEHWYDMIGNPTIADAVLDRLVHIAYRIELSGEGMRKQR